MRGYGDGLREGNGSSFMNDGDLEEQENLVKKNDGNGAETGKKGGKSRIRIKDWVGRSFGDLRVVAYDGKRGGKHYWRCRCICGGEAVVSQSNLQDGHTRSCGCRVNPAATRHFVEGTCIESIRSRKISARNSSGIRGVYQNKRTGRWTAQITFQGKTRYLGSYDSLEEAALARGKAEKVFEEFLERYDRDSDRNDERKSQALRAEDMENAEELNHSLLWETFVQMCGENMPPESTKEEAYLTVRSGHGTED